MALNNDELVMEPRQQRSTTDQSATGLLSTLATDVSDLLRGEMHLARAEIGESIDQAKAGVISIAVGVAVLLAGVLTLIAFLVLGVADWFDLSLWLGALIVGAIATAVGGAMVSAGGKKMSAESFKPHRTQAALMKDKQMVEEKVQ